MPLGLNRSGDFRNGSPVTLPHDFGNDVTTPVDFGNDVTTPVNFGNAVTWLPNPAHFGNIIQPNQQATPVFSPTGGGVICDQEIFITSTGADNIYYTTDGSTPTILSTPYSGGVYIASAQTVKAIAVKAGTANSAVGSATYTVNAPTVTSIVPNHGAAAGSTSVDIYGTNFDLSGNFNDITLDGVSVQNWTLIDSTHIQATSDVGSAGTGDVVVINPDGQTGTLTNGWTYDAPPAFTFVASGVSASAGATVTLNTTGATFLVAVLADSPGQPAPTIADNKSNNWHYLTTQVGSDTPIRIAYAYATTVGSGHIFTPGGAFPIAAVYAYAGGATTASCFVSQNGVTHKTPAPFQPGSVTPAAGDVVITGIANGLGSTPSAIDSGFTGRLTNNSNYTFGAAYLLSSNATPVNPTWTTGNYPSNIVIAVFKVA